MEAADSSPELQEASERLLEGVRLCNVLCHAVAEHDGSEEAHRSLMERMESFTALLSSLHDSVPALQSYRLPLELVQCVDEDKNPDEFFQKMREKSAMEKDILAGKRDVVDLLRKTVVQRAHSEGLMVTEEDKRE